MSVAIKVNEAIGGVFRGFVECLVESASKLPDKEPAPPAAPKPRTQIYGGAGPTLRTVATYALAGRGFLVEDVLAWALDDAWVVTLTHRCGSVSTVRVDGELLMGGHGWVDKVFRRFDAVGCYCVRPDGFAEDHRLLARLRGER